MQKGTKYTMNKKIDFSDKSVTTKLVYAAVIAILCITAIVVGIVTAASRTKAPVDTEKPPIDNTPENENTEKPEEDNIQTEDTSLNFIAPVAGTVVKGHSLEMPVFSLTLGEWRVHTGIDISCDEGANVFATESGVV